MLSGCGHFLTVIHDQVDLSDEAIVQCIDVCRERLSGDFLLCKVLKKGLNVAAREMCCVMNTIKCAIWKWMWTAVIERGSI